MDINEVLEAINNIGTCEDDVERRTLLDNLRTGIQPDYNELATLKETNQTLTQRNQELTNANMDLFLQIPQKKSENNNDDSDNNQDENKKLSYEDLFNEKGELM